ncbi:hypothetical protein [Mesonia sp. K7]|uniref:hypothetical protein n=1 Tax=Mesonia sp. K7 TaxID=2218606 RepID=UPI0011B7937B|nr:hypothetical protein [Mesonia sp. K7]
MKNFTFFLLIFSVHSVFSQQEQRFEGRIYADSISEIQVNIVNLTNHLGTTNSRNGEFSLPAKAGDSVIFSSVKYKVYRLKINEEHLEEFNTIFLENEVTELEEVLITNLDLTGDLLNDAKKIKTYRGLQAEDLGLPAYDPPKLTPAQRRYKSATSDPVSLLVTVLSGRIKDLKRHKAYDELEMKINKARDLIPVGYESKTLAIDTLYVDDFWYFCEQQSGFNQAMNEKNPLVMIEFLESQLESYKVYKEEAMDTKE